MAATASRPRSTLAMSKLRISWALRRHSRAPADTCQASRSPSEMIALPSAGSGPRVTKSSEVENSRPSQGATCARAEPGKAPAANSPPRTTEVASDFRRWRRREKFMPCKVITCSSFFLKLERKQGTPGTAFHGRCGSSKSVTFGNALTADFSGRQSLIQLVIQLFSPTALGQYSRDRGAAGTPKQGQSRSRK